MKLDLIIITFSGFFSLYYCYCWVTNKYRDAGKWFGITFLFTFILWFSHFTRTEPSVPSSVRTINHYATGVFYLALFGYFLFDQYKDRKVRSKTDKELLTEYITAIEKRKPARATGDSWKVDSLTETVAVNFFEMKRRDPNVPVLVQLMETKGNDYVRMWTAGLVLRHTTLKEKALRVLDEISKHRLAEAQQAEKIISDWRKENQKVGNR